MIIVYCGFGLLSLLFRFGIPSCEIASGCEKHHNFCTVVVMPMPPTTHIQNTP
jgi:hypothetical protein